MALVTEAMRWQPKRSCSIKQQRSDRWDASSQQPCRFDDSLRTQTAAKRGAAATTIELICTGGISDGSTVHTDLANAPKLSRRVGAIFQSVQRVPSGHPPPPAIRARPT